MKLNEDSVYNTVIIGAGATGSQLLPFISQLLNNFKSNYLKIIDGDIVEDKNLLNQKFLPCDIGRSKAEVLCERYQQVYPELKITCVDQYINNKEQLIRYLKNGINTNKLVPILVSCVDNNAVRKIFDDVFYDEDVPDLIYIDSGNGTTDRLGQVVVGYKIGELEQIKDHTGHYNYYCKGRVFKEIIQRPVADLYPEIRHTEETVDQTLSCSQISLEQPQNIATNILAAATTFMILNNIIAFNRIESHISYFNAIYPGIISRSDIVGK